MNVNKDGEPETRVDKQSIFKDYGMYDFNKVNCISKELWKYVSENLYLIPKIYSQCLCQPKFKGLETHCDCQDKFFCW